MHKNPAGASGGERNHKAAKRVHTRNRARLSESKVETGTAILFNSVQLARRLETTRSTKFCKWLQQLGAEGGELVEEEPLDEEEEAAADACIEEFNQVNISAGLDGIADDDIFSEEVVDYVL